MTVRGRPGVLRLSQPEKLGAAGSRIRDRELPADHHSDGESAMEQRGIHGAGHVRGQRWGDGGAVSIEWRDVESGYNDEQLEQLDGGGESDAKYEYGGGLHSGRSGQSLQHNHSESHLCVERAVDYSSPRSAGK